MDDVKATVPEWETDTVKEALKQAAIWKDKNPYGWGDIFTPLASALTAAITELNEQAKDYEQFKDVLLQLTTLSEDAAKEGEELKDAIRALYPDVISESSIADINYARGLDACVDVLEKYGISIRT